MARFAALSFSTSGAMVATAIVFCTAASPGFAAGTEWQARRSLSAPVTEAVMTDPNWRPRSSLAGPDRVTVGSISATDQVWKPRSGSIAAPLVADDTVAADMNPVWKPRSSVAPSATTTTDGVRQTVPGWTPRSSSAANEAAAGGRYAAKPTAQAAVPEAAPVVVSEETEASAGDTAK